MNAEAIIRKVLEQELMKHVLWLSAKKCACGNWQLPNKTKQYGTINLQHAKHVAEVVAKRLAEPATYREAA